MVQKAMRPSLEEVRELFASNTYERVPVMRELYANSFTEALHDETCPTFCAIGPSTQVGRYHSLIATEDTMPSCLRVTASTEGGEVMAVSHTEHPTFGLQFHPESILTPEGHAMARGFVNVVYAANDRSTS
ncbi:MAG: hypothetical protein IKF78_09690 [Atopobiaceae bacterium]|nr:hypothetical protein [Atopobiaceae bacterium]